MSKMFRTITGTWNPASGCQYSCVYCWARRLSEGRLRHIARYKDGFIPNIHQGSLRKTFKPGEFIFVVDMGDLFGPWVNKAWIQAIIEHIGKFPETDFLFCTKNPERYHCFAFPPNALLGITLETTEYPAAPNPLRYTSAPDPRDRYRAFYPHPHPRKFVSIEPIMAMEPWLMVEWMKSIKPETIEVGADTMNYHMPEPSSGVLMDLLRRLREVCPNVQEKSSLARLLIDRQTTGKQIPK